jgi:hypothetical protein
MSTPAVPDREAACRSDPQERSAASSLLDLYLKRVESAQSGAQCGHCHGSRGRAQRRRRRRDKASEVRQKLGRMLRRADDAEGEPTTSPVYPTTWGQPAVQRTRRPREFAGDAAVRSMPASLCSARPTCPLISADWQSYNEGYGVTTNPWDHSRTPGGSSGGSGAALAAGLTGLEAAQRHRRLDPQPAHYCGVFGHKPTWGVVSPRGHALTRQRGAGRHQRLRPAGARRRGSRDRHGRDGRARRDRRPRLERSACPARRRRSCATSRSRSCRAIPTARPTSRCRTRSRSSRTSSQERRPR